MPKLKVFVVYDSKVEAYLQPFFARTTGEALRMWEQTCNTPDTMMNKHPSDFTLFETAEFEEKDGRFHQHDALRPLGTALEAVRSQPEALPSISRAQ